MSAVADAWRALSDAVGSVPGLRVYTDPGASLDPPAAFVPPPGLNFEAQCSDPTEARFVIYVCVAHDDQAFERLLDLVPLVVKAIEQVDDAVVRQALPDALSSDSGTLPAYAIYVEMT